MKNGITLAILAFLFYTCSVTEDKEDPFMDIISSVLESHYDETVNNNCVFSMESYPRLYRKPEFSDFQGERVCDWEFQIMKLDSFTEDSVQVEFTIAYSGNRRVLRNVLRSWEKLEKRYETIDSLRIPDHRYGYAWTYTDPYDRDFFIRFPEDGGGIFSTPQWQQLEFIRGWFRELSDKRTVYSDTFTAIMIKREEWELISEDITDEYPADIHR